MLGPMVSGQDPSNPIRNKTPIFIIEFKPEQKKNSTWEHFDGRENLETEVVNRKKDLGAKSTFI